MPSKLPTQYMKRLIPPFPTSQIIFNAFIITSPTKTLSESLISLRFFTTFSSPSPTFTNPNNQAFHDSSCLPIHDNDLLKKTQKGNLLVLDMIDNGSVELDHRLYIHLLNRCAQLRKLKEGKMVHTHVSNSVFGQNIAVQTTALSMYAKCGRFDEARKVFDEMPEKNVVTWTALINGYCQNDKPVDALGLFLEMVRSRLRPNHFTFSSLLKAAGGLPSERDGMQIHAFLVKYGHDSNVYVGSSLVDMYARCGRMGDAEFAFEGLSIKNEVSWSALLAGYVRKGEGDDAIRFFRRMLREDFKPDDFMYSNILSACAKIGALEQGKWVHGLMMKSGLKPDSFIGSSLVDMYGKSGSIEDAKKVFKRLIHPDSVSWTSMLTACAYHGLGNEAVEYFEKMLNLGIKPDDVTFLCVLTACSHAGLLERGQHYFELMKKLKLEANASHYTTIVDLLGRAGLFDRAEKLIKEMPIAPTLELWSALLNACKMHKNMELGAYAAERMSEIDPYNPGPHIILHDIYASNGRWKEAAKLKNTMGKKCVKKEPAISWVEIKNVVHMFMASDESHPQRDEIYKIWEKIRKEIEEIGYVQDTSNVFALVDEEERETMLQCHSEKLALAFAVLNTPSESTVRIKKNIRVCGDCHSAFKFVSKVMKREIVLRDTKRFHHFNGGSCSCGDYW